MGNIATRSGNSKSHSKFKIGKSNSKINLRSKLPDIPKDQLIMDMKTYTNVDAQIQSLKDS